MLQSDSSAGCLTRSLQALSGTLIVLPVAWQVEFPWGVHLPLQVVILGKVKQDPRKATFSHLVLVWSFKVI